MGRSKNGGTRSLVSGKVGDNVYVVRLAEDGYHYQAVRVAPKAREDNNTMKQAKARFIMGHLQRFQRAFPDILADCFEEVPAGQTSYNWFAKVNRDLLEQTAEAQWDSWGDFGFFEKYHLAVPCGPWILSAGSLREPLPLSIGYTQVYNNFLRIGLGHKQGDYSVRSLLERSRIPENGFFYIIVWTWKVGDKDARLDAMKVERLASVDLDADIRNFTARPLFKIEGYMLNEQGWNAANDEYRITLRFRAVTQYYLIAAWGLIAIGYGKRGKQVSSSNLHVIESIRDTYLFNTPPVEVWPSWYSED